MLEIDIASTLQANAFDTTFFLILLNKIDYEQIIKNTRRFSFLVLVDGLFLPNMEY